MNLTDAQVDAVRSLLLGDADRHDATVDSFENPSDWEGYHALIASAFLEAVERRFGRESSTADVVRFVATARKRYGNHAKDIDPVAAERTIRIARGDRGVPGGVAGDLQIPLLTELVADEDLTEQEIAVFIAKARSRAEHMMTMASADHR